MEFYLPRKTPEIVEIPEINFVAVRGCGNPNSENGAYQAAMEQLYGIIYTIKMSDKGDHNIDGFFKFKLPPLEGFWWQEGICGIDYSSKETFQWISVIRLPEFVTREVFDWAVNEAQRKKKKDFSKAEFFTYQEGLCVQCMHIGAFDDEPATIAAMERFAEEQGYEIDITAARYHHEIYMSDFRRCAPEKLKTVIRHPVRKR